MKQENAILPKIDLESLRAFLHTPLRLQTRCFGQMESALGLHSNTKALHDK